MLPWPQFRDVWAGAGGGGGAFVLILPSAVGSWHFSHMVLTHSHWEVLRYCHLTTESVK